MDSLVLGERLELSRPRALVPKTSASTNSATRAVNKFKQEDSDFTRDYTKIIIILFYLTK